MAPPAAAPMQPAGAPPPYKAMAKTAPMAAVPEPRQKMPVVLLIGVAVACLLAGVLLTVVVLKVIG